MPNDSRVPSASPVDRRSILAGAGGIAAAGALASVPAEADAESGWGPLASDLPSAADLRQAAMLCEGRTRIPFGPVTEPREKLLRQLRACQAEYSHATMGERFAAVVMTKSRAELTQALRDMDADKGGDRFVEMIGTAYNSLAGRLRILEMAFTRLCAVDENSTRKLSLVGNDEENQQGGDNV